MLPLKFEGQQIKRKFTPLNPIAVAVGSIVIHFYGKYIHLGKRFQVNLLLYGLLDCLFLRKLTLSKVDLFHDGADCVDNCFRTGLGSVCPAEGITTNSEC